MSRSATVLGVSCLALATVTAAAGLTLDIPSSLFAKTIGEPPEVVTTLPDATAGSLTCPGTADKDTTPSILVQSVATEGESTVQVRYLQSKGATPKDERFTLKAGERKILPKTSAAVLDWAGAPVQASVVDAVGGLNSRVNCAPSATDQWDLVGFDTSLGSVSTLVLANPTPTAAVASLAIATPSGPVNLSLASGIEVPALNQTVIDLSEYVPNVKAFSVRVTTSAGRVVASGELVRREVDTGSAAATLGKVTGRARVVGVPTPSDLSIIPALGANPNEPQEPQQPAGQSPQGASATPSGEAQASDQPQPTASPTQAPAEAATSASKDHQLIIANPNDEQVTVHATASAPIPGDGVLGAPITVPAGSVAAIDMGDISTLPNPGVLVTSEEGLPVVAAVRTLGKDLDITNGVNGATTQWVLTAVEGAHVAIMNPGAQDTHATVTTSAGEETITIGANSVALQPAPATGWVRIDANDPVVASLRTATTGWSLAGAKLHDLTGGGLAPLAIRNTSKITTPALNTTQDLPIDPPFDLVPGGTRAQELPQNQPGQTGEQSDQPSKEADPSNTPSPSGSPAPLPVPSDLPAPIDEAPSESVNEDIFG